MQVRRWLVCGVLAASLGAHAQTLYRWVDKDGKVYYTDQPPPREARQVTEKRIGKGNLVEAGPTYALTRAQQDFPVTLYTDPQCTQACADARSLLARRGIPYAETVLKSEEDVSAFRARFGSGDVSVPSITVGSQKMIGIEEAQWNRMLDDAGYPRTPAPGARPAPPAAVSQGAPGAQPGAAPQNAR